MKSVSKTLTLGDVIEVPPIRLVMQLSDPADQVLDTFVITAEVEAWLRPLIDSLASGTGVGCFVKGHYGSGKSHFLSFLSLLARGRREAWDKLPGFPDLSNRRWLVVPVALQNYSGALPLEDIVGEAAEAAVREQLGRTEVLSDHHFLLENFNHLLLPKAQDFLGERTVQEWRAFSTRSPLEAAVEVADYLSKLPNNPLRTRGHRHRAVDRLLALARDNGLAGVLLLIDELSEYLKSKRSPREFNDDLRYLQFLGEATDRPLWIVATLQESMEQLDYEDQALYTRIKDRYRLRFSLSPRHVEDLIEKRLVRKKPGAEVSIEAAWKMLSDIYPQVGWTRERFYRIYPVHPATLTMLENLMGLFSRHRGVVDFVHTRLAGAPNVPGLLSEPPHRLLTCEAIFDHFCDRISEHPDYGSYVNTVWRFLEKDIPRLFESARDNDLATRCVKIMILTELSPLERPRTVKELAALVVRPVSTVASDIDAMYLKERILDRLATESSYVRSSGGAEPVYSIDLKANTGQQLEARLRQTLRGMDVGPDLWIRILKLIQTEYLPLAELAGESFKFKYCYWQYTRRDGTVQLQDLRQVPVDAFSGAVAGMETSERDWLLLIATPHQVASQKEQVRRLFDYVRARRFAPTTAAWVPREPSPAGLEACLRAMALQRVKDEVAAESEVLAKAASDLLGAAMAHLREVVVDCYHGGEFMFASGEVERAQEVGILPFDRSLLAVFVRGLEKLFPQHGRIHPTVAEHHAEDLERVWGLVVAPGRITKDAAVQQNVEKQLDGVVSRLGLVRRTQREWVVEAAVQTHPLLAEITAAILPGQTVPYQTLYQMFRKGPWGLKRELFNFTLAVLAWQGCCTLYHQGRAEPVKGPQQFRDNRIDAVGEGRVLDAAERERLPLLRFLLPDLPGDGPLTLAGQRELWQAAQKNVASLGSDLHVVESILDRHRGYQAFSRVPVAELRSIVAHLQAMAQTVRPGLDAKEGLARLLDAVESDTGERHTLLSRWKTFFSTSLDQWLRFYQATSGFRGDMPPDLAAAWIELGWSASHLDDVVAADRWAEVWASYTQFRERYLDWYRTAHDAWYGQQRFEALARLPQSPGWRLLERLSKLYTVPVDHDIGRVRKELSAVPRRCTANVAEALALGWRCSCGFEAGQEVELPPPDHFEALVFAGLEEYEAGLNRPETQEKLGVHVANLRQVERRGPARELASLAVSARKSRLSKMSATVLPAATEPLLEEVNRALAGQVAVVERSLSDLLSALEGRTMSPQRLREVFEKWLGGVRADVYVQIGPAAQVPVNDIEQAMLEDELPSMRPAELLAVLSQPELPPDLHDMASQLLVKHAMGESRCDALRAWSEAPGVGEGPAALLAVLALLRTGGGALDRYLSGLCRLPWAVDRMQQAQFEHRDGIEYILREAAEQSTAALVALDSDFTVDGLLPLGRVLEERMPGAPWVIVIMDAMRWDVWEHFRPEFERALPGHALASIEPVLAHLPSDTATNRAALLGDRPFTIVAAAEKAAKRAEVSRLLREGGPVRVVHFNLVDERIHETDTGPYVLYQELLVALSQRVLPYLVDVPTDATVLITADHGFRYDATLTPPYSHGGASVFERVIPAAIFKPR